MTYSKKENKFFSQNISANKSEITQYWYFNVKDSQTVMFSFRTKIKTKWYTCIWWFIYLRGIFIKWFMDLFKSNAYAHLIAKNKKQKKIMLIAIECAGYLQIIKYICYENWDKMYMYYVVSLKILWTCTRMHRQKPYHVLDTHSI